MRLLQGVNPCPEAFCGGRCRGAESPPENSVAVSDPFVDLRILSIVGLPGILSTIPFRDIGDGGTAKRELGESPF